MKISNNNNNIIIINSIVQTIVTDPYPKHRANKEVLQAWHALPNSSKSDIDNLFVRIMGATFSDIVEKHKVLNQQLTLSIA